MDFLSATPLMFLADASAAANDMRSFVMPFFAALVGLASVTCVVFLIIGGYHYMTSAGRPDKLDQAKKIIRNALIGLAIVVAAGAVTAVLSHSYSNPKVDSTQNLPALTEIKPQNQDYGPGDLIMQGINKLLLNVVQSIGAPVVDTLAKFTNSTPLMADTSAVFNLWLVMVAIADVLFILVVVMLGFHIMSADALGFEEVEFKHLLPQIGLVFLLLNMSIFAIDAIISLSNALIHALQAGVPTNAVWEVLKSVVNNTGGLGIAALFIMIAFLVLAIMLLIYYIMRLVVLFLGAVLSPLVVLLWLLPSFRDFANTAIRTYLSTIFVLFIHVVILALAATLFNGMKEAGKGTADPLMSTILGLATLVLLLRTQGVLQQMSYMSAGAKSTRKLGTQFVNGMSHMSNKVATAQRQHLTNQITNYRTQYAVNAIGARSSGGSK